ncbi:siphovirus ReqiPepy6 Gp37-like family protein [Sporofaciens sp. JLR.KK001]|uniref:siphovirus ReqiPepy6 Gp37-like family protein n=1 Tax=Sporofaciens sp. JLR.KK001 TaxID=3112621 RepID=UPI002FF0A997
MELRVFDETVEPLGLIDEMASLLWHVKYFDVGTFNLLAPITDNNKRLLTEGNIIVKHDGKREVTDAAGGIWRRAAQITYVHITKDENGLEQIEAQGYMLSQWLNKRCISPQIVTTATNQSIINTMVKNNCGSSAGTKRRFPRFIMLAQETIAGSAVEYANEVYAKLGQEVKARAQAGKLGYDILINERSRQYGFYLYKGKDLTAKNSEGNTPCIFSRDFDNVNEQEYTASIENCGNFIYIQGAADDSGSQPVTTVDGEGASGLELTEVFCDATDIARKYQSGETEVTIPLNTYLQMLKTRAAAELENYGKIINFVSTINTNSNLKFKQDFDLGDRITCKETKWGIQIDARITEVTETYQKGAEEIEATFGDSLPTLVDQIRKVR